MATVQEQISQAKAAGYSDVDIAQHLSKKPEYSQKFKTATDAGYKPEEIISHLSGTRSQASPEQPKESSILSDIGQGIGNVAAGTVRGFGSIGSTLLAPIDIAKDAIAGKGLSLESNRQRRADMDAALQSMGAEPESIAYQGGKLAGEIAGTAGAGGVLAQGARAVAPAATGFANALATGGMRAGANPGVRNMLTRAAGGGVTGGVSAGLVNPEDAGTGAMIGGALPMAAKATGLAGRAIGKAVTGGVASPEVKALAERASQLGIDVPADRIANSKPMNALAAGLNYVPFSGRAATENKMQDQLNRALSRTFGQDSENVTMALRKAQTQLGGEFDRVLQSNTVRMDQQFLTDLADAANMAGNELGSDGARIIAKQVDEIVSKAATGEIDGQAAYNIKKTLDRIGKRNSPEAYYARDLKKSLMAALDRSLGPQEAAKFAATRKQYGNMLSLENLAQNGVDGDVSIARIANMKNINNPDLQELADISAQFLKAREGQHGAAQRAFAGLGIGSVAGPAALAGSIAAGRVANTALNSGVVKNMMLGKPAVNPNNRLIQLMNRPETLESIYRSAPVVGAQ